MLDWLEDELRDFDNRGLRRHRVTRSGRLGPSIVVDGCPFVHFGSNDYLALAADPALQEAAKQAVLQSGWGSGASPLIVGHTAYHAELERNLAALMGTESALLFPTGFAANCGTIPALVGKEDVIFSDALNHASIIDGCRLSGARILVYAHRDMEQLDRALEAHGGRRRLIVSDGLFSMDGDAAHATELAELGARHSATVMVDEAHALGVFGSHGGGITEWQGVADRVDVRVGTLSKSLGSHGGFVAGRRSLVDFLCHRARSYLFSTAAPPAAASAALAALKVLRDDPQRPVRLLERAARLRTALCEQGWNVGRSESQIIPLIVGDALAAMELSYQLRQHELWVPCIRPPSVAPGESRLRISLCSDHTDEMIERLVSALAQQVGTARRRPL